MKKCTLCGYENAGDALVCRACKAVLAAQSPPVATAPSAAPSDAGWPPDRLDQIEREQGPPALFPDHVRALYAEGRRIAAHAALVSASRSPADAARRKPWIDDVRLWMEPSPPPTMFTINGVGSRLYGQDLPDANGTHVGTIYLVVLYVPVLAANSYVVMPAGWRSWSFYGRTPIPRAARVRAWIGLGAYCAAFLLLLVVPALWQFLASG